MVLERFKKPKTLKREIDKLRDQKRNLVNPNHPVKSEKMKQIAKIQIDWDISTKKREIERRIKNRTVRSTLLGKKVK